MLMTIETGVWRRRVTRFLLKMAVIVPVAAAYGSAESLLEGADLNYSGIYVSDRGSQIVVYAPSNSLDVIMDYTSPEEAPMVLYLRGDKTRLAPYSVRSSAAVNNRPVDILFDGDTILAGGRLGQSVRHPEKGFVTKGYADESSRMEAELRMNEYDLLWARLRRVRVELTPDTLTIKSSENARLPNAVFTRQSPLAADAQKTFQSALKKREIGLREVDDLVKPSK